MKPYGVIDPLGMFPLFVKRSVDVMAPRLSVVFRRLVHEDTFPACWRQANVTPIPKGPPSSSVANYRQIFIASVFVSVSVRLGVGTSWTLYGTQWCASKHPVSYRKCQGGPYTEKCIGEWVGGEDPADFFQFSLS